jgi:hypothetical protein
MGSCISLLSSLFHCFKSKKKSSLKKGSALFKAMNMTHMANGESISKVIIRDMSKKAQLERIRNDPNTNPEVKQVLSPPLSLVDKITDSLYLTGIGGITKENFAEYKITCVINATYEAPQLHIEGIECIRVPVSIKIILISIES